MKCATFVESKAIERFLDSKHFRHGHTRRVYAGLLHQFQGFVSKHSADGLPSVSVLTRWIKERGRKWPVHMVVNRSWLMERFLKWAQSHGVISENPFVALHKKYGPRTGPIVRALLSKESRSALQKLRPLPRFGSFLGKMMQEHVTHMQSLGYRYRTNEGALLRFDRFLQEHPGLTGEPLQRLITAWSEVRPCPQQLLEAQKVGRMLSKALHRLDPRVPILSIDADLNRRVVQQQRKPHVHTDEEIQKLLQTALSFSSALVPLRARSLYTILALTYCAGLRISEICRLTMGDLDLQDSTIDIRQTKFFKDRRLPLAPGVMGALQHYLEARRIAQASQDPKSSLFWNEQRGGGYAVGGLRILLTEVSRRAGLKPARGRIGPRTHDLRHTMVGHRMRDWYNDGINPQSKLPYLATYLGHKDINSTLVYLNITPELLQKAAERFRTHGVQILRCSGDAS